MNREKIEELAFISRLAVADNEIEDFEERLNRAMDFMSRIKQVDLNDLEPLIAVNEPTSILRADQVEESLPIESVLENAQDKKFNYFSTIRFVE